MKYPSAGLLFSAEKYSRHHTPDAPSSNLLDGINLTEDDISHLLYLSSLSREKAGPSPEVARLRLIPQVSLFYLEEMMNLSLPSSPTTS